MEGEGRARRSTAGTTRGRTGAKSALQELAELRKSGGKRVDRFELKEEEAVYDVVDDAEYAKLVQKRREEGGAWGRGIGASDRRTMQVQRRAQEARARPPAARRSGPPVAVCCVPDAPAGGFVIDEDGLGYADVGEEIDWGTAEEEQGGVEGEGSGGKGKGKKGAPPGGMKLRHAAQCASMLLRCNGVRTVLPRLLEQRHLFSLSCLPTPTQQARRAPSVRRPPSRCLVRGRACRRCSRRRRPRPSQPRPL